MSMAAVQCAQCGALFERTLAAVNRARRAGLNMYCSGGCSSCGRRRPWSEKKRLAMDAARQAKEAARQPLTATRLRAMLSYDPHTGLFRRLDGRLAGSRHHSGGIFISVDGRSYAAHRLAWLYVNGEWPNAANIDHANGDRADNRIANLREADASQNQANSKRRRTNKSGFKGVVQANGRWAAAIYRGGKQYRLGRFDSPEEAHAAYVAKAREIFGEFANGGFR